MTDGCGDSRRALFFNEWGFLLLLLVIVIVFAIGDFF